MIEAVLAILSTAVIYLGVSVHSLKRSLKHQLWINEQIISAINAQNRMNNSVVAYLRKEPP